MSNKFVFGKKGFKTHLKQIGIIVGGIVLVSTILGILILPSRFKTMRECDELGLGGGLETIIAGQCTKSFDEIIFVLGDTSNTPAPSLNYPDYINTALNMDKANISVISVSDARRNPKAISKCNGINKPNEMLVCIEDYFATASATNDGADYLEAIQTSAEFAEDKNKALIYVIGSGLSDRGALNFADNSLLSENMDAEDISKQVSDYIDNASLLKGITIVWDGIGQTVAPQPALNEKSKNKLKTIYESVFRELGNKTARFKNKLSGDTSVQTSAKVKITQVAEDGPCFSKTYAANSTSAFKFNGDSATFVDPSATEQEIGEVVSAVNGCPNAQVEVTAYMSRGECSRQEVDGALLNDRLNAIKNLLVSHGVSSEKIKLMPGGFGDAPECNNGVYNNAEGEKNRRVDINVKSII